MAEDFAQSRALLDEFFNEVNKLEGNLAGGEKLDLGKGGEALKRLRETRIEFGNPRDKLILLTEKLFEETGFTPGEIHKRQRNETHDFYYMTVPVNLFGEPGVEFDDLICELDFEPKGKQEPIIQALFPTSEWHDVLSIQAGSTLSVNTDFGFEVGLDTFGDELAKLQENLPGSISAKVQSKNNLKGQIVVPDFKFTIGRKEIAIAGLHNSICRWTISSPELHKADNVEFGVVFKVPKECKTIKLTGLVTAEPSLSWLGAQVRHLAKALPQKFRDIVSGKGSISPGDGESWEFDLAG
jgi:hypothetical protein